MVKYRRNITLEPMNAYERHVIHETLQDYPDVITYSTEPSPTAARWWPSPGKHALT
ncbi:MAG: R3H domain-containing nucleic acid-binding protein [Evtepia gabavorous]